MNNIKEYNYSKTISYKHQSSAIKLVNKLIKSGNYADTKKHPKFQTNANLYQYEEMKVFVDTFIYSCFHYLNIKKYKSIKMWCYRSNFWNSLLTNHTELWHSHDDGSILSGVYYLKNERNESTEFLNHSVVANPYTWYIYPSSLLHRPPKTRSLQNRHVIAADFYYQ